MTSNQPKISIITVVRNAGGELEKTIQSVLKQDYNQIEFIIIDGGSADGTVEIIKSYSEHITNWISEPDHGIYDAMNKGLTIATGEWVNFMNAGDIFFDSRVLSSIFNKNLKDTEVLYGDSIACYPVFMAMRKALPLEDLWKGMICCHQAIFVRTSLIRHDAFRPDLYFSADYEMIVRLYSAGKKFRYIPLTVAVFDTRGMSNVNMVKSARSNFKILSAYRNLTPKERRFHWWFIGSSKLTEWIYKNISSNFINSFLKWVYRNEIIHESQHP